VHAVDCPGYHHHDRYAISLHLPRVTRGYPYHFQNMSADKHKTTFPFPHATVTPIIGRPDPLSLGILQGELYANAISVPTELGGGSYGHLALVMPAAEYVTMDGAIAYIAPAHPGVQADVPINATAVQITQLNRQHDKALDRHMLHANVSNALKQQLLEAVDDMFVSILRHQRLRYSQVAPQQLLQHLINTYNIVTEETLEDNRNRLSAEWNPDEGMEVLYTRITNVQQFAAEAGDTHRISDSTAMHLILTALARTGMFTDACADWRKRNPADQTLDTFKNDMDHAWKERNRRVKAKDVGYHDALSANMEALSAGGKEHKPPGNAKPSATVDSVKMYYCWSHGLGFSDKHTSHSCLNKKDGHQDDATVKARKGGSTHLNVGNPRTRTA